MPKYSTAVREAAVAQMKESGVAATHAATNIAIQTLYKWRREAEQTGTVVEEPDDKQAASAALQQDEEYLKRIEALEKENAKLGQQLAECTAQRREENAIYRKRIAQLKKALQMLISED